MEADYRVRTEIRHSLEKNYCRNQNQPFATHIAFQVAFCYQVGFGIKSHENKCHMWLEKSNIQSHNLKIEKEAVQLASWRSGKMNGLRGLIQVDLIHEYRTCGLDKMREALKVNEREVVDMTREFGELHFIPIYLYITIGDLLDELGEIVKSKTLRIQIRDHIQNTEGIGHQ